ncbi:peptide ABC transporter substrate-binding protein [Actinomyces minihominis]|uniref:peptide ABC transporter substrate-binding protein n=1 Tax=Actinomyces minihominis TaxID=2002838 RepID=UPI000C08D4D5|nr:ABC transporter substrate-binding protein [Actinomyces minihominis]
MSLKRTWLALPAVLALSLAACSTGGSGSSASGEDQSGGIVGEVSAGMITANSTEPQNPLIPTNTNEVGGGKLVNLLFAGLVYYAADGSVHNDAAESIETEDSQNYTVKLKADQVFSDGTPVTAASFVDAWNLGASKGHLSAYFFAPIAGTSDDGLVEDGDTMSGLKVVDDTTFTIELKQPESDFPIRLGYSAFFPLPQSTLDDLEKGGENPIGNGPYKVGDEGWVHNERIQLVPSETYTGDRAAKNGGIDFIFYPTQTAAYADLLSGQLDVLDAIPDEALAVFEQELGERAVNQPAAVFQSFTIPERLDHFSGEEGDLRRQAISMSINREEITEAIFSGTRTPARDFTSPVIAGWDGNLTNAVNLDFNPEKAQELWAQADAINAFTGKFELAYNADGGHQAWVDAVANQLVNNLGIDALGKPYPDFKSLRDEVTSRTIKTAFRTGWQADYPALGNFLGPLYGTGAGSNDGDYSNPDFDALLSDAAAAPTVEEGNKLLQDAQEILLEQLPAIPLWYSNVTGGYSEAVQNVEFGWDSVPLYQNITK